MIRHKMKKKEKIVLSIFIVLLSLFIGAILLFHRGTLPYTRAEKEAKELAKTYGNIVEVYDFYYYHRNQTYYTIRGLNKNKKHVYVIVPQNGEKIDIVEVNMGLTEERIEKKVKQDTTIKEIQKITLGKEKNQLVWEVTALNKKDQMVYFLFDFKTGQLLHPKQVI